MTTSPSIFGKASGFLAPASTSTVSISADIMRHVQNALLQGDHGSGATSPVLSITARSRLWDAGVASNPTPEETGAGVPDLIERIRSRSSLKIDEIGGILGVSRRALHNWKNGDAISSGNERRLRELDQAVRRIAGGDGTPIRNALMSQREGGLRVFDLLAEGRFDIAVAIANGTSPLAGVAPDKDGLDPALAARLEPVRAIKAVGAPRVLDRRMRLPKR